MPEKGSETEKWLDAVSGFMGHIHNNSGTMVAYSILQGADINDDRQHEKGLGMDVSPLYFGIAGLPDKLAPEADYETLGLLLAAPHLDPNAGLSVPAEGGGFTRRSPLLASLENLMERATQTNRKRGEYFMRKWEHAGCIVEDLCKCQRIDIEYGEQVRTVGPDGKPTDKWSTPLEALLKTAEDSVSKCPFDSILLLALYGANMTGDANVVLERILNYENAEGRPVFPADHPKIEELPGDNYEVDEDYEEYDVPRDQKWRWDMIARTAANRLRTHHEIWQVGWRPEFHAYFPKPYQNALLEFLNCSKRIERYDAKDLSLRKGDAKRLAQWKDACALTKKMNDVNLEEEMLGGADDRSFEFDMSPEDAKRLVEYVAECERASPSKGCRAIANKESAGLRISASVAKAGLHMNCMPLNLQLGTAADSHAQGGGVWLELGKSFRIWDAACPQAPGVLLRDWQWATVLDAKTDFNGQHGGVKPAAGMARVRVTMEDDPGLPLAGSYRFLCPALEPGAANDSGGGALVDLCAAESQEKWQEAMEMREDQLKREMVDLEKKSKDLEAECKHQPAEGIKDKAEKKRVAAERQKRRGQLELQVARTYMELELQQQHREVYLYRCELNKLERLEQKDRSEEEIMAQAREAEARGETEAAEALWEKARQEENQQEQDKRTKSLAPSVNLWKQGFQRRCNRLREEVADAESSILTEPNKCRREAAQERAAEKRAALLEQRRTFLSLCYTKAMRQVEVEKTLAVQCVAAAKKADEAEAQFLAEKQAELDAAVPEEVEDGAEAPPPAALSDEVKQEAKAAARAAAAAAGAPLKLPMVREGRMAVEVVAHRAAEAEARAKEITVMMDTFWSTVFSTEDMKGAHSSRGPHDVKGKRAQAHPFWMPQNHGTAGGMGGGGCACEMCERFRFRAKNPAPVAANEYFTRMLYAELYDADEKRCRKKIQRCQTESETLLREEQREALENAAKDAEDAKAVLAGAGGGDDEDGEGEEGGGGKKAAPALPERRAAASRSRSFRDAAKDADAHLDGWLKSAQRLWERGFQPAVQAAKYGAAEAQYVAKVARLNSFAKKQIGKEKRRARAAAKIAEQAADTATELSAQATEQALKFWHKAIKPHVDAAHENAAEAEAEAAKAEAVQAEKLDEASQADEAGGPAVRYEAEAAAEYARIWRARSAQLAQMAAKVVRQFWESALEPLVAPLKQISMDFEDRELQAKKQAAAKTAAAASGTSSAPNLPASSLRGGRRQRNSLGPGSGSQASRPAPKLSAKAQARQAAYDAKIKQCLFEADEKAADEARNEAQALALNFLCFGTSPAIAQKLRMYDTALVQLEELSQALGGATKETDSKRAAFAAKKPGDDDELESQAELVASQSAQLAAEQQHDAHRLRCAELLATAVQVATEVVGKDWTQWLALKEVAAVKVQAAKAVETEREQWAVLNGIRDKSEFEAPSKCCPVPVEAETRAKAQEDGGDGEAADITRQQARTEELRKACAGSEKVRLATLDQFSKFLEQRLKAAKAAAQRDYKIKQNAEKREEKARTAVTHKEHLLAVEETEREPKVDAKVEAATVALSKAKEAVEAAEVESKELNDAYKESCVLEEAARKEYTNASQARSAMNEARANAKRLHADALLRTRLFLDTAVAGEPEPLKNATDSSKGVVDKELAAAAARAAALAKRWCKNHAAGRVGGGEEEEEEAGGEDGDGDDEDEVPLLANNSWWIAISSWGDASLPLPPSIAGEGLFYEFDNLPVELAAMEARAKERREAEKAAQEGNGEGDGDGGAGGDGEELVMSHEEALFREAYPVVTPVFLPREQTERPFGAKPGSLPGGGGGGGGGSGKPCKDPTGLLPVEFNLGVGKAGLALCRAFKPKGTRAEVDAAKAEAAAKVAEAKALAAREAKAPKATKAPVPPLVGTRAFALAALAAASCGVDEHVPTGSVGSGFILMHWPWQVVSQVTIQQPEVKAQDGDEPSDEEPARPILEVLLGGMAPPKPGKEGLPNVLGLPAAVLLTWSARFQGGPCQLARGTNTVHPLEVLEYRVERRAVPMDKTGLPPPPGEGEDEDGEDGEAEDPTLAERVATVSGVSPDSGSWRGGEEFRWTADNVQGGLLNGREYQFRITARNKIGWGKESSWSTPVPLMETAALEVEQLWRHGPPQLTQGGGARAKTFGLKLPISVVHRVFSFLRFDNFPPASGPARALYVLHPDGRVASDDELRYKLRRFAFDKFLAHYRSGPGGHSSVGKQQQLAASVCRGREQKLARGVALMVNKLTQRRRVMLSMRKQRERILVKMVAGRAVPVPNEQSQEGLSRAGPTAADRLYRTTAAESDDVPEALASTEDTGFFDGLGLHNGAQERGAVGIETHWASMAPPTPKYQIGDTLFIPRDPTGAAKKSQSLRCGLYPLLLEHDDEAWVPVCLQAKREDGTVDYEILRGAGVGASGWRLRQAAYRKVYDPVRKTELFLPRLLTSEQLQLWRRAKWKRLCGAERLRVRISVAKFKPGMHVVVDKPRWFGRVCAVNADGTYSVIGEGATPDVVNHSVEEQKMAMNTDPGMGVDSDVDVSGSADHSDAGAVAVAGLLGGLGKRRGSAGSPFSAKRAVGSGPSAGLGVQMGGGGSASSKDDSALSCDTKGALLSEAEEPIFSLQHYAAAYSTSQVLHSWLDSPDELVSIDRPDPTGCTALHWAASSGRPRNTALLLKLGANPNAVNYAGFTPAQWTKKRNQAMLMEHEAQRLEDAAEARQKRRLELLREKAHTAAQRKELQDAEQRAVKDGLRSAAEDDAEGAALDTAEALNVRACLRHLADHEASLEDLVDHDLARQMHIATHLNMFRQGEPVPFAATFAPVPEAAKAGAGAEAGVPEHGSMARLLSIDSGNCSADRYAQHVRRLSVKSRLVRERQLRDKEDGNRQAYQEMDWGPFEAHDADAEAPVK
jgi:hypothetical protein